MNRQLKFDFTAAYQLFIRPDSREGVGHLKSPEFVSRLALLPQSVQNGV